MTTRHFAIFLYIIMVACAAVFAACGSGSNDDTNLPQEATGTARGQDISTEMLQGMIPGVGELPGFTRSEAGFLDNEGASAQAPDPAARLASLNEMGRIVGYHAIFTATENASADAPQSILWSVNLFQEASGALEFIRQQPETPEGVDLETLDVSALGSDAVGYTIRGLNQNGIASAHSIAFAEGAVEVGLTTLYGGAEPSQEYTLDLAQRAQALVEQALLGGPSQPSTGDGVATPGSPAPGP